MLLQHMWRSVNSRYSKEELESQEHMVYQNAPGTYKKMKEVQEETTKQRIPGWWRLQNTL